MVKILIALVNLDHYKYDSGHIVLLCGRKKIMFIISFQEVERRYKKTVWYFGDFSARLYHNKYLQPNKKTYFQYMCC